ncbi:MAG: cytochrome c [Acidobacteria bacterium]|nr:cytochrome c [Acidobacteriota bacterium]
MMDARKRRHSRTSAALLALALLLPAAPAEAQPNLGSLMRQKLDRAQQLFEAVVLARFPAVRRHAGELLRISEESTWMAAPTTAYVQQSGAFQEAARDLGAAAGAGDMEEVATAYMTLVATCVQCHRQLRGAARAELLPGSRAWERISAVDLAPPAGG